MWEELLIVWELSKVGVDFFQRMIVCFVTALAEAWMELCLLIEENIMDF